MTLSIRSTRQLQTSSEVYRNVNTLSRRDEFIFLRSVAICVMSKLSSRELAISVTVRQWDIVQEWCGLELIGFVHRLPAVDSSADDEIRQFPRSPQNHEKHTIKAIYFQPLTTKFIKNRSS